MGVGEGFYPRTGVSVYGGFLGGSSIFSLLRTLLSSCSVSVGRERTHSRVGSGSSPAGACHCAEGLQGSPLVNTCDQGGAAGLSGSLGCEDGHHSTQNTGSCP